jgi:chromosome segregation ATPase
MNIHQDLIKKQNECKTLRDQLNSERRTSQSQTSRLNSLTTQNSKLSSEVFNLTNHRDAIVRRLNNISLKLDKILSDTEIKISINEMIEQKIDKIENLIKDKQRILVNELVVNHEKNEDKQLINNLTERISKKKLMIENHEKDREKLNNFQSSIDDILDNLDIKNNFISDEEKIKHVIEFTECFKDINK